MLKTLGCALLLLSLSVAACSQESKPAVSPAAAETNSKPKFVTPEAELGAKLLTIRRIYVDSFGDDAISKQMQAMVITSLSGSKRFIITENKDRADAILRGTGLEKTSQELHAYDDATSAGHISGAGNRDFAAIGGAAAAIKDSSANTETIDRARLAVRLVDRDGDVVWSTTQESQGAKYKGASADVSEKIVKQLLHDLEREEKANSAPATSGK